MNKKIFYWGLYDFANSLISGSFTLYFSQWLIIDNKLEDIWYSSAIAVSTLILIITAPLFGSYSDRTQRRMRLINPLTIIMAIGTLLVGFI
ncbi:MAG: MFS transporter, partial [Microgenomates group bacterium]